MYIIHSADKREFEDEIKSGEYGRKSIEKYGFIHCSDLDTYYLISPKFKDYIGERIIILIDTDKVLNEIKWEGDGDITYPHIYGLLNKSAIVNTYKHLWSDDKVWIPNDELIKYAPNGFKRK